MPLINIVIVVLIAGFGLWAIGNCRPITRPVRTVLKTVIVVVLCLWLLQVFGIIDSVRGFRIG